MESISISLITRSEFWLVAKGQVPQIMFLFFTFIFKKKNNPLWLMHSCCFFRCFPALLNDNWSLKLIDDLCTFRCNSAELPCSVDRPWSTTCSWCSILCNLLVNPWAGKVLFSLTVKFYICSLCTLTYIFYANSFCHPVQTRRKLLSLVGEDANAVSVLGANFSAGFVAGSLAAATTCPLDVAKTRRQIEVIYEKQIRVLFL